MKLRNQLVVTATAIAAVAACTLFSRSASAQVTVFSDNFTGGSTVNSGAAPTANSTSYSTASGKSDSSSMAANDFNLSLVGTVGAGMEAMAQFTTTPVTLGVGDYIDFTYTFVNTSNLLNAATAQLYMGLYISGGVSPLTNLDNNISTAQAGGSQGWLGYAAMIAQTNGTAVSKIWTRPAQTLAGADQEVLGNDAESSSQQYDNPKGGTLSGASTGAVLAPLTKGATYTEEFRITETSAGFVTVTNTLYNGAGTGGAVLYSLNGTSNSFASLSFDALAFGWYMKGAAPGPVTNATAMDVSSILVTTDIPEPSTIALLVGGLALMIGLVRRRRHS